MRDVLQWPVWAGCSSSRRGEELASTGHWQTSRTHATALNTEEGGLRPEAAHTPTNRCVHVFKERPAARQPAGPHLQLRDALDGRHGLQVHRHDLGWRGHARLDSRQVEAAAQHLAAWAKRGVG